MKFIKDSKFILFLYFYGEFSSRLFRDRSFKFGFILMVIRGKQYCLFYFPYSVVSLYVNLKE